MNGSGRCPECGSRIARVTTRGPGDVRASPCGCRIASYHAEEIAAEAEEIEEALATDGGVDDELIGGRFERVRDGRGTAYTVGIFRLDGDRFDALDAVGYAEGTLYVVFTDGRVLGADHDRHRLARDLGEDWLVDALREVEEPDA